MSAPWSSFAGVVDTLMKGNFPSWTFFDRNRVIDRPAPQALTNPAKILQYDFENTDAHELIVNGRTLYANGAITGTCWVQGNAGDSQITGFLDQLQTISDAWYATPAAGQLMFYNVLFNGLGYVGDALKPDWSFRDWKLPFLYISPISAEEEGILGGISTTSIQVYGPSLALLDFVGLDTTTDPPSWRRVRAADGEPSCLGMVSVVLSGDQRQLALGNGWVRIIGGHGFSIGDLYLSQTTPGAVGAKPDSGVQRKVADVINATDLIVLMGPEVTE